MYGSAVQIIHSSSAAFRSPGRVPVSQGASSALKIVQPGGYTGPWSPTETPYMVDPMDELASRKHESVCFIGPARSGKTMALLDGWFTHVTTNDPGDMLIIQMTQDKAREYSKTRIDRAIRHSKQLQALRSASGHDDNTYDKMFRHGMWLKIGWPSATQVASSDYRYAGITDYDRIPDDIDGEGSLYMLALKRTTTFLSRGMCMVESSPGRELQDPNWQPQTRHEGPPCGGIVAIYNSGDRRRRYWPCPHCGEWFHVSPGLELFSSLPGEDELLAMVRSADLSGLADEHAVIFCPHCHAGITSKHKHAMSIAGQWLRDGQEISRTGVKSDGGIRSSIASFWLSGIEAAYQSWQSILLRYLQGLRDYAMTGAEETLKSTTNTDQAMPYLPRHLAEARTRDVVDRSEDYPRYFVPDEARFLIATVDVQGGQNAHFVCEVRAFGPWLESWMVDRFKITTTERNGRPATIDPAGFPEDWDIITQKLILATYRMHDGRELRVRMVLVDSGGEEGVTANAYAWRRRVVKAGHGTRAMLIKGASNKQHAPCVLGHARDGHNRPVLSMPHWNIDTNYYKDVIAGHRRRTEPGPGYFHIPKWLGKDYFDELNAETRGKNGKWVQNRKRNEALDLWVYALAACDALGIGPSSKFDWITNVPMWALPLDVGNSDVISKDERIAMKVKRITSTTDNDYGDWNFERRT